MERKESVSVDEVQFALAGMRESPSQSVDVLGSVQAEKTVQPLLDRVVHAVPDWFIKAHFKQGAAAIQLLVLVAGLLMHDPGLVLFSETLDEFQ